MTVKVDPAPPPSKVPRLSKKYASRAEKTRLIQIFIELFFYSIFLVISLSLYTGTNYQSLMTIKEPFTCPPGEMFLFWFALAMIFKTLTLFCMIFSLNYLKSRNWKDVDSFCCLALSTILVRVASTVFFMFMILQYNFTIRSEDSPLFLFIDLVSLFVLEVIYDIAFSIFLYHENYLSNFVEEARAIYLETSEGKAKAENFLTNMQSAGLA